MYAKHLMAYVPLLKYIREKLDAEHDHKIDESVFLKQLGQYFSDQAAEEVLTVAIDWGRYAEIFAYDYNSGDLSLEDPE